MSVFSLCNTSGTFQRKLVTADAFGGHVESFANEYPDVPISLQPVGGKLVEKYARMGMEITHRAFTETPLSLKSGDRLVVGDDLYIVTWFENAAGRDRLYVAWLLKRDQ